MGSMMGATRFGGGATSKRRRGWHLFWQDLHGTSFSDFVFILFSSYKKILLL